jgi:hypothetical protein
MFKIPKPETAPRKNPFENTVLRGGRKKKK